MSNHSAKVKPVRWYGGGEVPMAVIRRFARAVAERFHPERIMLFGSHAYGTPHADSDVDILVIMRARNQLDQAVKIECACEPPFPLDIIVRTPSDVKWRLKEGDSFLREIIGNGKILYEEDNARVGRQGGKRLSSGQKTVSRKGTPP